MSRFSLKDLNLDRIDLTGLTPARLATWVLGGICALMLLIATLQSIGLGGGYTLEEPEASEPDPALAEALMVVQNTLPPFTQYSEIEQRPLFNADRRPAPIEPAAAPQVVDQTPPAPLTATLAGIVLTPSTRVALVRNDATQEMFRVREGMPLPGELGAWRLKELQPRNAVFDGGTQGQAELKLDPAEDAPPAPPPPPPPPGQQADPNQAAPGQTPEQAAQQANDAAAREAEVRRIIEERRRQMREEAERMNAQKKQN